MTIAIVVETGAGTNPAANSYASIADLRSYAAARGITVPVANDDCAILLIRAMDYLEAQRERYKGVKTSPTQPLQWPRSGVWIDGVLLGDHVIPRELVNGQLAQCLLLQDQAQNPDNYSGTGPLIELTERVEGAITETKRWASPSSNPGTVAPVSAFTSPDSVLAVLYKRGGGFSIPVIRV